ncbi:MAG TPA: hypothetical protein VLA16_00355, partial [Ideonella sp.]|nr:hypothetical protein [Ideonella sp.]
ALVPAGQVRDLLSDAVVAQIGPIERAQAAALAAEAQWLLKQRAVACPLAAQALPVLTERLPGSPEQWLLVQLAQACGLAGAAASSGAPDDLRQRAITHWRARAEAISAR